MKKRISKAYLIFFLVILSIHFMQAQIINIEEKEAELLDTIAWFGSLQQDLRLVKNTSAIFIFRTALNLGHVHYKHIFLSLTDYKFSTTGNEQLLNQGFQHFRYVYKADKKVFYEAFTQIQYNDQIKLKVRWLLGGGVQFNLISEKNKHVNLGLSYMYEYNEEVDPDVFFRNNRLNSYLVLNFNFFKKINFLSTTYYQPDIINVQDWRLSSRTSMYFNITKKLLFKFGFNLTYDSKVPPGVPNAIYSLSNGITWRFW
jgi:Protein of unknown function, DUF481